MKWQKTSDLNINLHVQEKNPFSIFFSNLSFLNFLQAHFPSKLTVFLFSNSNGFVQKYFKYLHLLRFYIILLPKIFPIKKLNLSSLPVFYGRRYFSDNLLSFGTHALYITLCVCVYPNINIRVHFKSRKLYNRALEIVTPSILHPELWNVDLCLPSYHTKKLCQKSGVMRWIVSQLTCMKRSRPKQGTPQVFKSLRYLLH